MPTDSTSFYRGFGPLASLRKKNLDISIVLMDPVNWTSLSLCDIVFMQRPSTLAHRKIAGMAKDLNIPLWVDYDDFLFAVPEDNPAHRIYGDPEVKKNISEIITIADRLSVSTQHLADLVQPLRFEGAYPTDVIPNALDTSFFNYHRDKRERIKLVTWRGSDTHQRDLMEMAEPIVTIAKNNPSWTFHFMGYNPWFITSVLPAQQCIITPPIDPFIYHRMLEKTSPEIMIVPLSDHDFNKSKSNIAWIEATFAGAAVLAPAWAEWEKAGVTTYGGSNRRQSFKDRLQFLINMFEDMPGYNEQCSKESWSYIKDNLTLETVNLKREAIIRAMAGERKYQISKFPDKFDMMPVA